MAVTHVTALRNTLADAAVDAIDGGAGAGLLEFRTSGDVEVATLTFSDPAFGAASSGTATASAITADASATGGGGDIELNSVVVSAGQQVSVSAMTYSAPA